MTYIRVGYEAEAYELGLKLQNEFRTAETLKATYLRQKNSTKAPERIAFEHHAMNIIEMVSPRLFENSNIVVMTTPTALLSDPVTKKVEPVVAMTRRLKAAWHPEKSDEENIKEISDEIVAFFNAELDPVFCGGADYTADMIMVYELIIPCELFNPDNGTKRYGLMTRYAKRRFERPSVPSFNHDEGEE